MKANAHLQLPGDNFTIPAIDKIVCLGNTQTYGGRSMSIYCHIQFQNGKLSISGVEGPLPSGNCLGVCGQIDMHLRDEYMSINLGSGWTRGKLKQFFDVWREWHLNDMNTECEHQKALGWTYKTHPSNPCPTCGYKLGTAWKRMEVPQEILTFLKKLPETNKKPAWV